MKESFFVDKQLASQLMEECQALAVKELLVDGIRERLARKKVECIKGLICGHLFRLGDDVWVPLGVSQDNYDNSMTVYITFGRLPEDIILPRAKLTEEEKKLLKTYREHIDSIKGCTYWSWRGKEAEEAAERLGKLKHHYELTKCWSWNFNFEDASYDSFYTQTGMSFKGGDNFVSKPLESCVINKK